MTRNGSKGTSAKLIYCFKALTVVSSSLYTKVIYLNKTAQSLKESLQVCYPRGLGP